MDQILQLQQGQIAYLGGEFPQFGDGVRVHGEGEAGAAHSSLPWTARWTGTATVARGASSPVCGVGEVPADRERTMRAMRARTTARLLASGLYSVTDAVDDASEVSDAVSSGLKGDTDALWGQAAGLAAGIAVESACQFAGFAGAPTAGVGAVAVEVGCAYASTAVGDWTASTVESNL
ncbi:hypothetical protein [Streptomyces bauhiniae]|uniref:hypothetical protein n=1 Tax=Streptomyces bauhiniae TaxID=2340725 RepID=UPI00345200EA